MTQGLSIALKGEMNMINVLHLYETDVSHILSQLMEKRDESPQFFIQSPLVVDCSQLPKSASDIDYYSLKHGLRSLSFIPVGMRHLDRDAASKAIDAGWAILRDSIASKSPAIEIKTVIDKSILEEEIHPFQSDPVIIRRPVRSGQQVYSPNGDVVVLSHTSAGSEILANGSVHVYGRLCGRVLAGVNGDRAARIFCQALDAELIAIAGNYQLLDETNTALKGLPAMIYLDDDKLKIEPLL